MSHVNDDMNTDLPESLAAMLRSLMIFQRLCVVSSALPTLNQRIVNLIDVTMDMDADPLESSAPMINSDLMIVDWENIFCDRPRYGGQDGHDMIDTDSSDPNVRKRIDMADLLHMCRTVQGNIQSGLFQNPPTYQIQDCETDDNLDTDSIAELEYIAWDDACAGEFQNMLGNIPLGLVQNPQTDNITKLRNERYFGYRLRCGVELQRVG